ncbi:ABC transporter ATP-binding protein [Arhodomonas sp. SL1]|uniref:ABC transporter ATP-binding protein n=1 Tax=Arhodomonas sp. SL1 TaxID=3425691 RepID=UPI003F8841EF
MQARKKNLLKADGIHVDFGGIRALGGVDLALERDEILGLIGPNGAGKTTLVNVLTGFQAPTLGQASLDAHNIGNLGAHRTAREGIARTFQSARLFSSLSVLENLTVAAIGVGEKAAEAYRRACRILEWMGCADKANRPCGELSYGDERRIGIARALATYPSFLLLDEPASGMNESECEDLMRVIFEIPGKFDCGILLIEHNMKVIMQVCQRIHVLDGGMSLADGLPEEVQKDEQVRRAYLGDQAVDSAVAI